MRRAYFVRACVCHCSSVEVGSLPTLQQLGFDEAALARSRANKAAAAAPSGARLGSDLRGGESEALRQLDVFVKEVRGMGR